MTALDSLKANASLNGDPNMTIWFGHYPTPSIISPDSHGLQDMINGPYLSGHVHMNNLYAVHGSNEFLDIELADWRAKRKFRIAAVDHGIFSFDDLKLDEWPIVLITNPKASLFNMPTIEPLNRIKTSTHIRVLIFSRFPNSIKVKVRIGSEDWKDMRRANDAEPLFVAEWNPNEYSKGSHRINVMATDPDSPDGRVSNHEFSLDGTKGTDEIPALARWMMSHYFQTIWGLGFFIAVFISTVPLLMFRALDFYGKGRIIRIRTKRKCFCRIFLKMYLLCCVNRIFVPILAIPLYATFGPWLVGRVIEGHFGIAFVWGLFVEGSFLPGGITYVLGMVFLALIHGPITLCISHAVHNRYMDLVNAVGKKTEVTTEPTAENSKPPKSWFNIFMDGLTILILCIHFAFSLVYYDAYGIFSWIFGFLNTWSLFIYVYLWRAAGRLSLNDFPESCLPRGHIESNEEGTQRRVSAKNEAFGKLIVTPDDDGDDQSGNRPNWTLLMDSQTLLIYCQSNFLKLKTCWKLHWVSFWL